MDYGSCFSGPGGKDVRVLHAHVYVFAAVVVVVAESVPVCQRRAALCGRVFHLWAAKPGRHGRGEARDEASGRIGGGADRFARLFEHGSVWSWHWCAGATLRMGRGFPRILHLRRCGDASVRALLDGESAWV